MAPRNELLLAGATLLALALFGMLALTTAYWPFQSVVQVIAPFLLLSILTSMGTTLLVIGFILPSRTGGRTERADAASAIDSLLLEMKKRP